MLLWLMFAGMTAAVLAVVLRPAFRTAHDGRSAQTAEMAVYTEQLADLERQVDRGQLEPAEFRALHDEVARRLLRIRPEQPAALGIAPSPPALPFVVACIVPIACVALYVALGSPGVPGRPFSASASQLASASAAELIAKVEARLASHPEDGRGWDTIAPIYFRLQRFGDAADAFQRASRLLGETAPRLAGYAESVVLANDGIVTEPARAVYEKLRTLEPDRFEPRFWLALAKEQDGKRDAAAADYRAMLADAPADAPWRNMVEQRLAEMSRHGAADRAPTGADMKAAENLTAAERQTMIEGMVENLANRLKANGNDLGGWQKLISSYVTLKKPDRAKQALVDAHKALAADTAAGAALDDLARSLELKP